jgi:hypothetical protein
MRRAGEDIVDSMDRRMDLEKHVVYKLWFYKLIVVEV